MLAPSENLSHFVSLLERTILGEPLPSAPASDFYSYSYPHIQALFAQLTMTRGWNEDAVMFGFSTLAAWMPHSLQNFDHTALAALPDLLNTDTAPQELARHASDCVKGSMVTCSKFLHFYQPAMYPLYTAQAEALFWPTTKMAIKQESLRRYLCFQAAIEGVSPELKAQAQQWAYHWFGYATTATRAVESLVYYAKRRQSANKAKPGFQLVARPNPGWAPV
jgi:hypothetical protein